MLMIILITVGFMVLDVVTGAIQAILNKTWTSEQMRVGLTHKLGLIGAIALCVLLAYAQTFVDIGATVPTVQVCCAGILFMETGSIIENLKKLNPDLNTILPDQNKDKEE